MKYGTYKYEVLDEVGNASVGDDKESSERAGNSGAVAVVPFTRVSRVLIHGSVVRLILVLGGTTACNQLNQHHSVNMWIRMSTYLLNIYIKKKVFVLLLLDNISFYNLSRFSSEG